MNKSILDIEVQNYINANLHTDPDKIAFAKSPFANVSAKELVQQVIAKKKSEKKLPTWFNHEFIYYPPPLSIEQCSSEITAGYKARLAIGETLIDLTGGFGVDSMYFAKAVTNIIHCEINAELSQIAAHNAAVSGQPNIKFLAADGIEYLKNTDKTFDTIYIDPARRGNTGKVFMLKDCKPDVVENLDLLLSKSRRVIIKTAPLLDLTAGLKVLKNVSAIHILSTKNECKELIWVMDSDHKHNVEIHAVTLNRMEKQFIFNKGDEEVEAAILEGTPSGYVYEPDAALLKSGAFNLIALRFKLQKLHAQTQLYTSEDLIEEFPGRIFKINKLISPGELKKEKQLSGNVIVRNYRDTAENLSKKHKIKPDHNRFLIFTHSKKDANIIIDADIVQHY